MRTTTGPDKSNTLFMLGGALVLVVIATTYGQIRLNNWNQPFYDALSRRDLDGSCISWACSA